MSSLRTRQFDKGYRFAYFAKEIKCPSASSGNLHLIGRGKGHLDLEVRGGAFHPVGTPIVNKNRKQKA
jgi:hypothetical protein